jgi:GNAT superfamily N-acetyltransferase
MGRRDPPRGSASQEASVTVAPSNGHGGRPHVRAATAEDIPALVELWDQLRVGGNSRNSRDGIGAGVSFGPEDPKTKFLTILDDPDRHIVVATVEDRVEGLAVMSLGTLGPMSDARSLQLAQLVVEGGRRRRGVGRALIAAATAFAEDVGAEHVVVSVYPHLREANRFYARLGFTPLVVRRVATVAALRRRLTSADHPAATFEEIARRRIVAPRLRTTRRRAGLPR